MVGVTVCVKHAFGTGRYGTAILRHRTTAAYVPFPETVHLGHAPSNLVHGSSQDNTNPLWFVRQAFSPRELTESSLIA